MPLYRVRFEVSVIVEVPEEEDRADAERAAIEMAEGVVAQETHELRGVQLLRRLNQCTPEELASLPWRAYDGTERTVRQWLERPA